MDDRPSQAPAAFEPIFVARQPIFDAAESVFGYELLFRRSGKAETAQVEAEDVATASVIADGFTLAFYGVDKKKKAFINFPQSLLTTDAFLALPKDVCVVEILETVKPTPEVLATCKRIKEQGYLLALDDYVGGPGFEAFITLTDIVKVDVYGMGQDQMARVVEGLRRHPCRLLAEKIETAEQFVQCKKLGFSYFQGFFFSRPQTVAGSKIPTAVLAKMRLMKTLASPDYDLREVAKIVSADPSLSYRLLNFINSALFSLPDRISSIKHALTLIGLIQLKQWFLAVVISDLDRRARIQEVAYLCVLRGRFLESLARTLKCQGRLAETLFMLGLFSKLDALLGQPMPKLLDHIHLDKEVAAALLGEDNRLRRWLELVQAIEAGDWDKTGAILDAHHVAQEEAAGLYAQAVAWTQRLLSAASQPE